MASNRQPPILIIGAGLVGLTLAQSLKSLNIPFQIFERDASLEDRNGGWAITMHWVMPFLEQHLSKDVFENIKKNHVQPEVLREKEVPIKLVDLKTGESMFERKSPVHLRIDRSRLREVLSEGIDIQWNSKFEAYEFQEDGETVTAKFESGEEVKGSIIAVCDGKNSTARTQLLGPGAAAVTDLPFGFIGLQLSGTEEETKVYRDVAPIFWQGAHPETGYFVFCSMLSTPATNRTAGRGKQGEKYEVQLNLSWTLDDHDNEEPPKSNEEKLAYLKNAAKAGSGFYKELNDAIQNIPSNVSVLDIKLQDWPTEQWPSMQGRVTLLGDAAHPMTMYRGQAANHGMYDAVCLADAIGKWYKGDEGREEVVKKFEEEMIQRGRKEVLASRQACFEAHYPRKLREDGELLTLVSKPGGMP